jgi:hypothetical protein
MTKAKTNDLHQAATTFKHQNRIAESADENRGLVRPSIFMQRLLSNRFPHDVHEMILFAAHHEPNPRSSRINYFVYFFAPFKCDQSALPIYFNDDPVDIASDTADCLEIYDDLITVPYLYGFEEEDDRTFANRDALPCGRDIVTIGHEDDDADLYTAPERPVIKPRFNDVARVVHRWNREHKPLNALATTIKKDEDGDERLMYPTPSPSDEHFDPVVYPIPWNNDPVPEEVLRLYPRSHHEEPQNEDDRPIIDVPIDWTIEAPRGPPPPWRDLPGGFYQWLYQWNAPEREDVQDDREHEGSVSSMDCLVTRAHRYIRDW